MAKPFNSIEIKLLLDNYPTFSNEEISSLLPNRNKSSIRGKVHRMGLKKIKILKRINFKCKGCNINFEDTRCKEGVRKFCTSTCRRKWQSENIRGINHPRFNQNSPIKNCKSCSKEFRPLPCKLLENKSIFCSRECYSNSKRKVIHFQCLKCEKEVSIREHLRSFNNKFCSVNCSTSYHSGIKNGFYRKKHNQETLNKILFKLQQRPTSLEKNFIDICNKYNLPFEYTGYGKVNLGGKNPDFVHQTKKMVIEIFGRAFHDKEDTFLNNIPYSKTEEGTTQHYAELGYNCVVLWGRREKLELEEDKILELVTV